MDMDSIIFTVKNKAGLDIHKKCIIGFDSSILLCSNPKCVAKPSNIFNNEISKLSTIIYGIGIIIPPIH